MRALFSPLDGVEEILGVSEMGCGDGGKERMGVGVGRERHME